MADEVLHQHAPEKLRPGEIMDVLEEPPKPLAPSMRQNRGKQENAGFADWMQGWFQPNALKDLSPPEKEAQKPPKWSLNLYKADFSYSLFVHNGTEFSVVNDFPGVSAANLSNPESATLSADYIARVQRDWTHLEFFAESDLNYGRKMQRGKASTAAAKAGPNVAYQVSQTADYWYHDAGFA